MARHITTAEREETVAETPVRGERDDRRVLKLEDVVWFLLAVVMSILIIRFVLLLLGAKQGTPFVDFMYGISSPFIAPFAGIFGNSETYNVYAGSRLEPESIVAMLVYGLLAYILVLGIRLFLRNPERRP